MGRKDAAGQHSLPVDQYRKQIGKQDWKKSRREIKSLKARADESNELTPQRIILMIGLVIVVLSVVYVLLVWSLSGAPLGNMRDATT